MTKTWDYGDAGDRYPVKTGDIWRVGPHILACGDLELSHAQKLLTVYVQSPHMTYVDPPWTPSLLTGFRTKANLSKGQPFDTFLDRLIASIKTTQGDCYIEMGNQHINLLRAKVEAAGGTIEADFRITYYKRKPARLIRATFGYSRGASFALDGLDDEDTPRKAIAESTVPYEWVWDPCTGKGLTAVAAASLGRRFIGLELHPRRLAVAIERLVQTTGQAAQAVGTIG
jgi:hypothetical protein